MPLRMLKMVIPDSAIGNTRLVERATDGERPGVPASMLADFPRPETESDSGAKLGHELGADNSLLIDDSTRCDLRERSIMGWRWRVVRNNGNLTVRPDDPMYFGFYYDDVDPSCGSHFLRGDCNDDGSVDLSDAVCTLDWLFLGGGEPGCVAATNANGDKVVDLSDAVTPELRGIDFSSPPPPRCTLPSRGTG